MAAIVKAKLKASREAIQKKDFQAALKAAEEVLTYDASNYYGNVFLGRSAFELGELEKCEQAYRKAIDIQPDHLLAWQGVEQLQEKNERWDDLDETLEREVEIAANAGEATKVAEFLQKLIDVRRKHGSVLEASLESYVNPSILSTCLSWSTPCPCYCPSLGYTMFFRQSPHLNLQPLPRQAFTTYKSRSPTRCQRLKKLYL
ncbi:Superkiller protein 3 [Ceratobasidium sp. UAMH 11750]|nr:Superkiller protein 3 [Ceratobasidium sp. UAMH 11750]